MSVPFLCVFLAFLMNYFTKVPVAVAQNKLGGYDNNHPREQQANLTGWGKRALGAHMNSFEMFPAFAASVIIAYLVHPESVWLVRLPVIFVLSRVIYTTLYIGNWGTVRSLVWGVGLACVAGLFLVALF